MDKKINEIEVILDKLNLLFASVKEEGEIDKINATLINKYAAQLQRITGSDTHITETKTPVVEEKKVDEKKIISEMMQPDTISYKEEIRTEEELKPEIKIPEIKKSPEPEKKVVKKPLVSGSEDEEGKKHHAVSNKKTLGDKITTHKAKNLNSVIQLNDKLFFVKELFHGNSKSYEQVVQTLNSMEYFSEIKKYIETDLAAQYNWHDHKAINRLLEVVKLKFSS